MAGDRIGDDFETMLAAAKNGAGLAFECLWRAYIGPVTGYVRLQGAQEPDDVASEVFLSAFRTLGRFNGDESEFRSWLFTIAHRRIVDTRRRSSRRVEERALDDTVEPGSEPGPEPEVLGRLAEERVRTLCDRLVADQRDVLLLRLVGGVTVEEAAAVLGKSAGAVKALQRRGLVALRTILEREGVTL